MSKSSPFLSENITVLSPGLSVGNQKVTRGFQPSFTVIKDGTVFSFCQGRLGNGWDDDVKAILMSISKDGGRNWGEPRRLSAPMNHFALSAYTFEEAGVETVAVVVAVDLHVTREFYRDAEASAGVSPDFDLFTIPEWQPCVMLRVLSKDGGNTWEFEMIDGERSPLGRACSGYVPTFINMIGQIQKVETGPHAGRIFTSGPVYAKPVGETLSSHFRDQATVGSAVIYSDDNGASWQLEGIAADYLANESSAVLIEEGSKLLMVRRRNQETMMEKNPPLTDFLPPYGHRIFQTSEDWGRTWSDYQTPPVSGVRCHGTLCRIGQRLYFSIPQGTGDNVEADYDHGRERGTIYYSDDDGQSWTPRVLEPGTFSYSTVGQLSEEERICFFAQGVMGDFGIGCRIFNDAWLDLEA